LAAGSGGRLLNAVLKSRRQSLAGSDSRNIALKFKLNSRTKSVPGIFDRTGLTIAQEGRRRFHSGRLSALLRLSEPVAKVLGDLLSPEGTYFMYCNNIDLLEISLPSTALPFILPCDESTVWKEMLELMSIDKTISRSSIQRETGLSP